MVSEGQDAAGELRRFAEQHDLTYAVGGELPRATYALIRSRSSTGMMVSGSLPGGLEGLVADRSYQVRSGDETVAHHSLVLIARVPETVGFAPMLLCQDASAGGGMFDLLVGPHGPLKLFREIELESIKFNGRYRVGIGRAQDENWVRQLFDPVFVDWLADRAPEGCFFELMNGVLCASSSEDPSSSGAIERLCAFAAYVAKRLRSEVSEQEGLPGLAPAAVPTLERAQRSLDAQVDRVRFETAPADVRSAAKRYRSLARRRPITWIFAFGLSLVVMVLPVGFLTILVASMVHVSGGVSVGIGGALLLASLLVFVPLGVHSLVRSMSTMWGFEAFIRGYAATRGLESVDAARYRADHARLRLPGVAVRVLSGQLPGGEGPADIVVTKDTTGRRKGQRGNEAARAVVLRGTPDGAFPLLAVTPRGTEQGYEALGGFLVGNVKVLRRPAQKSSVALSGGIDDRIREHFEIVADDRDDPRTVTALLSSDVAETLLSADSSGPLGIYVQTPELVVFTSQSDQIEWSAADFDRLCQTAGLLRGRLIQAAQAPRSRA
jgi:hypothetical protein